eukprot:4970190-Pleurochrysis_carterae.AAC.1
MLGVDPKSSPQEVKRAMRKVSLLVHPDKCVDVPGTTEAMAILNDAWDRYKSEVKIDGPNTDFGFSDQGPSRSTKPNPEPFDLERWWKKWGLDPELYEQGLEWSREVEENNRERECALRTLAEKLNMSEEYIKAVNHRLSHGNTLYHILGLTPDARDDEIWEKNREYRNIVNVAEEVGYYMCDCLRLDNYMARYMYGPKWGPRSDYEHEEKEKILREERMK